MQPRVASSIPQNGLWRSGDDSPAEEDKEARQGQAETRTAAPPEAPIIGRGGFRALNLCEVSGIEIALSMMMVRGRQGRVPR